MTCVSCRGNTVCVTGYRLDDGSVVDTMRCVRVSFGVSRFCIFMRICVFMGRSRGIEAGQKVAVLSKHCNVYFAFDVS